MDYQHLLLNGCDPDQLTEVIDGTDMRHRVLPGGQLIAEIERMSLTSGVIQRGRYGMAILADGAWPKGLITVGVVLHSPDDVTVNGHQCPPLSVQLYGEGCELSYRAAPGSTWFAYCIERERIQKAALRLHGRPLPIPETGSISIRCGALVGRRITATVQALFSLGAYPEPRQEIKAIAKSLQEQLHWDLACALHAGRDRDCSREARCVARNRRLMKRAEDYLHANRSKPFSLGEFAEAAGTSRRMLEYHFHKLYGTTPSVWFRSMKLNAIRRELQQSQGADKRITDTAMRWGFLHLGRFSEEYRRLFGERPKDTLKS